MALALEIPGQYGDARECIRAARRNLEQVRQLLSEPVVEAADASAAILREVEVELGCIAAAWRAQGASADPDTRASLEEIKREIAFLAEFFAQTERLFQGWIGAIESKRSGYNECGRSVPLVFINRVKLEG